eukprot:gene6564-8164_t
MNPFQFDIRNIPEEGKHIAGTLPASFFQLPESEALKAASPMNYELTILRDGKDIIVTGQLGATFELQCGRCLDTFPLAVDLAEYQAEIPIEKETTMDLTELIREDILLALPNFPRCEDGNVEPRDCPAEGKFDPAELAEADEEPGSDRG